MQDSDDLVLDEWCRRETAYWSNVASDGYDFDLDFERLNETRHSIFILDIDDGNVAIRPKPALGSKLIRTDVQEYSRIQFYKDYLEESLRNHAPGLSTTIAVDVHDMPTKHAGSPLFCFQKTVASHHILLPDVDFMQNGWYQTSFDEQPYAEKAPRGVFAGSSTGGGILTCTDVLQARTPRLRLSRNLHGHADIDFTIAAAVQCDSPATEALLMQQPYFSGPVSWEDQLKYRFLISIDGNGATCSRVVNSLRSQSVLLKFTSPHRLYYFHGLCPWEHYVPIDSIGDISTLIDAERNGLARLETIVENANSFFERFLKREAVHAYGAKLLSLYADTIAPKGISEASLRRKNCNIISAASAHISGIGDVSFDPTEWIGDPGRLSPIEGLCFQAVPGTDPASLSYRCHMANGETTNWSGLGAFVGSKGQAQVLVGLEFGLPDANLGLELTGFVRFANGVVQTISPGRRIHRQPNGIPITAVRLWLSRSP